MTLDSGDDMAGFVCIVAYLAQIPNKIALACLYNAYFSLTILIISLFNDKGKIADLENFKKISRSKFPLLKEIMNKEDVLDALMNGLNTSVELKNVSISH